MEKALKRYGAVFVLPTFIAFAIGFIWPFCQGIYLSFCKFTTTSNAEIIGFGNYVKAITDPGFMHAFWYTALYAVVSVVLINVLAFASSAVSYSVTSGV